ncbi:uncharacterized protein LOC107269756 isoform X2 [Cephus cinctus]|uniref:Uncharacterized protein LOC107269756 isoform X2 n=1 Tax=Cephus cinctus TaxID=211228 RepID=A0AAJ7C1Y3_CEPCN|nr:uncharacterized protein LOC107269756 isoform X2 [Cephus cinctus]
MESRPAPLRSRRVCRFCLTETEPLNFIYERDHSKPFQVPLTLQIMSCVAIEVYAADGMPQMICTMCRWNLDRSYKFKLQCKKADEALRAYPLSGVLPRPFPPISNDPPETGTKRLAEQRSQNEQSKKPKVENNERDRRDTRERERERERQSEKQISKVERHDLYDEEQDGGSEGDHEASNEKEDRKLEPGEIRVHACDQCDRTFPLRQALQLHVQRAHRDRNYKCTECDRMFFSKYDLAKHMTTHSEEKPFTCPICHKQFSRANLLQRHEKVHREELRYGCQHCDREFFTTDELEKHEETVHKAIKPYQCNICNKRFTYKQGLERHEMLHNEDNTFVCEYCKEAFRTSTKLARHLSTHSGHRPYLCKLCPRTFLLSHHLTRHMRSHSVEKRHVCEDCGKAFKRKESLEVHQLTHSKRSGMGLTCDVCQESCRNRADYVTHIKQHIEAGEKMGPDGLPPDTTKDKPETDSEEEEEEEQYSDGDDDYEPPSYIVKKLPKTTDLPDSEEERDRTEKEDRKEQIVFVRGKDGNVVKKTIKTLMPIQRREIQETKMKPSPAGQSNSKVTPIKSDDTPKSRVDETEAQNIPQEQAKDTAVSSSSQIHTRSQSSHTTPNQSMKEEKADPGSATPKSVNTVKVIKRIVVRKSAGGTETSGSTTTTKEADNTSTTTQGTPGTAHKVTKRVIVRRIIRQGDTTREVIMNPDGTIIDPAELAKLPAGNVVKRVVVKKPMDKNQTLAQSVLQTSDHRQGTPIKTEQMVTDSPKLELKTSQTSTLSSASMKTVTVQKVEQTPGTPSGLTKGDQETKEKLEQLEKRVEQQRLKIEELQARKQQEYEPMDEMLPERHDESEDEQQLPLKRVFVKRKQSIYDEEQEYNDNDKPIVSKEENQSSLQEEKFKIVKEDVKQQELTTTESSKKDYKKPTVMSTSKVYGNKKIVLVKTEEPSEVEEMSRELSNILDSAESVVKMQENVLSSLSQIPAIGEGERRVEIETTEVENTTSSEPMEVVEEQIAEESCKIEDSGVATNEDSQGNQDVVEQLENEDNTTVLDESHGESLSLTGQDLSEATDIFGASESTLDGQKSEDNNLEDSVITLSQSNDTINLTDPNDTQDSLEDKLSQMEG